MKKQVIATVLAMTMFATQSSAEESAESSRDSHSQVVMRLCSGIHELSETLFALRQQKSIREILDITSPEVLPLVQDIIMDAYKWPEGHGEQQQAEFRKRFADHQFIICMEDNQLR
jgi:hypothetical protein